MTLLHWAAAGLASAGVLFALVAVVGILRLPDLLTRMHAASKAGTLGAICTVLAAALFLGEWGVAVRGLLIIVFMFLTAPVAAHMIARAAYTADASAPPAPPPDRDDGSAADTPASWPDDATSTG